jgi:Flp pilus assembly protein TadG
MRLLHNQRGTAMVEFAIVALPLFLILFGIVDFARALNYYNDLTQLSGQAARAAAVNQNPFDNSVPVGPTTIQQQIADHIDSPEMKQTNPPASICITVAPPATGGTGDPVTAKASYDFHFLPLIGATINLSSTQTERFEALSPGYTVSCAQPS